MPLFNLSEGDRLDPLAPFKVLAVMCHPADLVGRERMVGLIQRETGSSPRRHPVTNEDFRREVQFHSARAGTAGHVLLTQLQLSSNGYKYDLNRAIALVSNPLPKWDQPASSLWSREGHIGHLPRSRRKILAAITEYRSVAHLWAAMIHGLQNDRPDIWPGDNATLPLFLAVACRFLELAGTLPTPDRRKRGFLMSQAEAWRFSIPPNLERFADQVALPLDPRQLKILNELEPAK